SSSQCRSRFRSNHISTLGHDGIKFVDLGRQGGEGGVEAKAGAVPTAVVARVEPRVPQTLAVDDNCRGVGVHLYTLFVPTSRLPANICARFALLLHAVAWYLSNTRVCHNDHPFLHLLHG
ncbi:unnamed protein product, partial [Ectocarpus sp. 12 AP-2014]